jgi:hypothetical protein
MVARGEDVGELGLTFDAATHYFGDRQTVTILDGMAGAAVQNFNAELYVNSYVNFMPVSLIESRFEAFRRGFALVTREKAYGLLEPAEMDVLVSGKEVMDWGALQRAAAYADGYAPGSLAVRWFWEIFSEFSDAQRRMFLKFATCTDRSPMGGLGNVRLVIQRGADPDRLPVAHTCFNTLTLPDYRTKTVMTERLLLAIEHTEGFGIV